MEENQNENNYSNQKDQNNQNNQNNYDNQNSQNNYNDQNSHDRNYNNYSENHYNNSNYSSDRDIKRLYRSRVNKMLCGVCGGVANYFGCDPTIVRLLYVFLAFCSCGTAVIAYIVMAIVVPETPFNE